MGGCTSRRTIQVGADSGMAPASSGHDNASRQSETSSANLTINTGVAGGTK